MATMSLSSPINDAFALKLKIYVLTGWVEWRLENPHEGRLYFKLEII